MSAVNLKTLRGNTPAHVFVFRPGGVQGGNVYTGWTDLMVALDAADGPREILFDDSIVSPCVVPAGGPYVMTDVLWKGRFVAAFVEIADGASFTNLFQFERIYVTNASMTSPMTLGNYGYISIRGNAHISQADVGFAPMYDGSALTAEEMCFVQLYDNAYIGFLFGNNETIIDIGDSTFQVFMYASTAVYGATIAGGVAATIKTWLYTSSALMFVQPAFAGSFSNYAYGTGAQYNVEPERGLPAAVEHIDDTQSFSWLRLNANAGIWTQTMPRVLGAGTHNHFTDGRVCVVSETGGVNGITLDGYLDETIDGAATFTLPPGATMQFISDGVSNWTSLRSNRAQVARIINTDSPYTVLANDRVIFCDTDGGAIEVDLPAGIKGTNYKIVNTGSSGNDVTVDGNAAEEIYGALTQLLSDGEVVDLHFETTEGWW